MSLNKIKAIIVDDESTNIETLDKMLFDDYKEILVVARCQSPLEAVKLVEDLQPDVVFLDISMPEMSGFEFLNQFSEVRFKVVFITAFSEYALKAIKYAAFDFLLKPVISEELKLTIEKVKKSLGKSSRLKNVNWDRNSNNLALPTLEGLVFIDVNEILYCQSDNSYTIYHVKEGKRTIVSRGLKETSELLEKFGFFRIHQSYLVNGKYIRKYNRHNSSVVLINGEELPVSVRRREEFLAFVHSS